MTARLHVFITKTLKLWLTCRTGHGEDMRPGICVQGSMAAFQSIGFEPGDLTAGTRHRQGYGAAGLLKFSAPTPPRRILLPCCRGYVGLAWPAHDPKKACPREGGGCRLFGHDHAQIMRKRTSTIITATYDVVLPRPQTVQSNFNEPVFHAHQTHSFAKWWMDRGWTGLRA
jgi:hypothetical protein